MMVPVILNVCRLLRLVVWLSLVPVTLVLLLMLRWDFYGEHHSVFIQCAAAGLYACYFLAVYLLIRGITQVLTEAEGLLLAFGGTPTLSPTSPPAIPSAQLNGRQQGPAVAVKY